MLSRVYRLPALSVVFACASAAPLAAANLARSAHFEVYSQAGERSAQAVVLSLERLRALFLHETGLGLTRPVRVIVFRSRREYDPYRLRPAADAYYVGTETADSIVMIDPGSGDFRIAAHEYAHAVLDANLVELPPWLSEGLAEVLSAVRLDDRPARTAAEMPYRAAILRSHPWMPLAELVTLPADSPLRDRRDTSEIFYAESWAFSDMLMASPVYSPRSPNLFAALSAGTPSLKALSDVYAKPLEEIARDLRVWVQARRVLPIALPHLSSSDVGVEVSEISPSAWRALTAELLVATGKLDQAQTVYQELAREAPENADVSAALARLALRKHDLAAAREYWQKALVHGIRDAAACYRYAVVASEAGMAADDVEQALERAVLLQPAFDDAHFMLAHLENNAGRFESAVEHLRSMAHVSAAREFPYWTALAYALGELGRRDQAKAAADHALESAKTPAERSRALELAEIAQTDVAVRFARDANGTSRLVTTRVPHDAPDFNPFIEPADLIGRVEGKLQEISCSETAKIVVQTATGALTIAMPDPLRVQMRNAPPEFICGLQPLSAVTVVYAIRPEAQTAGILRGIEFH